MQAPGRVVHSLSGGPWDHNSQYVRRTVETEDTNSENTEQRRTYEETRTTERQLTNLRDDLRNQDQDREQLGSYEPGPHGDLPTVW